jgi:ABC-type glycerol-3-phosphate transport system substrate-binding protein
MRVVRWALGLLAAIAVATALGACGSSDGGSTASASSKDSPGSITVGIPVDDASYGPLYLAVD